MLELLKKFKFQITLTGVDGQPISKTFHYDGAKTGTIQSGGSIALKHGESITIHDIPAGTAYQVEELVADGYKVTSEGTTGTIRAEGTVTASFTNTRNDDPGPGPDPDPDPDDPIGNLTLSKTVRGDDRNGTFTFRVTFTTRASTTTAIRRGPSAAAKPSLWPTARALPSEISRPGPTIRWRS